MGGIGSLDMQKHGETTGEFVRDPSTLKRHRQLLQRSDELKDPLFEQQVDELP